MSREADSAQGAGPGKFGRGVGNDGGMGSASKGGTGDPECSSAARRARPQARTATFGPPDPIDEAGGYARPWGPPRRPLRWINPLLLVITCVLVGGAGWSLYRGELPGFIPAIIERSGIKLAAAAPPASSPDDRDARPLQQQLEQERALRQDLEQRLEARRDREREALEKARSHTEELERQLAERQIDQEALASALRRERARTQALQKELESRDEQDARARPSAPAGDAPSAPVPVEAAVIPAVTPKPAPIPATMAVSLPVAATTEATTERPARPAVEADIVRLMARAQVLLDQGDIGAARTVLAQAADAGNPLATFKLAESYDPAVLAAWGTVGTQGDAAKARELYAKAAAGGVEAAQERLERAADQPEGSLKR